MMSFISFYGTSEHSIGWLAVLLDASVKKHRPVRTGCGIEPRADTQFGGISSPDVVTGSSRLPLPTRHFCDLAELVVAGCPADDSSG